MPFQAVIFDMDGVITDSEPLYAEALNEVLARDGHRMSDRDHAAIMGSSVDYTVDWIRSRFGINGDRAAWLRDYDLAIVRLLSAKAEPAAALTPLLDRLKSEGLKVGLASSSQHNWVLAVLGKLGIRDRFQAIAAYEMVKQAKPAPDLYLLAARTLAVDPAGCIAIEDSPRGIRSAKAAGMRTIAVRTATTAGMDISAADHVVDSLAEFPWAWLLPPSTG